MQVECPECGGDGRCEYDKPVVDWVRGGFIDTVVDECETCHGFGKIEIEDEDDD